MPDLLKRLLELLRRNLPAVVAVIAALVSGAGIGVAIVVSDDDPSTPDQTITVTKPPPPPLEAARVPAPASEVHDDLSSDNVPQLNAAQEARARAFNSALPGPRPLPLQAGPPPKGCSYYRTTGNYSSRNGSPILFGVAHRVIAPNRPGKGDILGTANYLAQPGVKASTTALVDYEANCLITVDKGLAPWTQIGWNRVSCSVENQGNAGDPISAAQYRMNARVFRWCGIPARKGIPSSSGRVVRSGVLDHQRLPFNSHYDIRCHPPGGGQRPGCSYFTVDPIIRAMRGESIAPSHLTKRERGHVHDRCVTRGRLVRTKHGSRLYHPRLVKARRYKAVVHSDMRAIDRAKRRDHKPWSYRHRGTRRKVLAGYYTGKRC